MIGYINPTVPLLESPAGIDAAIQDIQIALRAGIDWLGDMAFGRAFKQEQKVITSGEASRRLVYYPEVYQVTNEPLIVMPNDNVKAQSFFYVRDPGQPIDYTPGQYNIYNYPVSLVVWGNLNLITPASKGRYTEVLKLQVLELLRANYSVEITAVFESFENVYSNYTITEDYREYMKLPYTAFRIDFNLSFKEVVAGC